jgi:rhodanese-related sulfurtransferase
MDTAREISVQDLPADAVLLDVREPDEWAAGHAEGATHVPLGEVPERLDELPDADPLYVVCRSGNRSGRAVAWLARQGIESVNVAGGMRAWAAAGRPMVSDSGEPTVL